MDFVSLQLQTESRMNRSSLAKYIYEIEGLLHNTRQMLKRVKPLRPQLLSLYQQNKTLRGKNKVLMEITFLIENTSFT